MLRLGLPLVAFIVSPMLGHGQVQIQIQGHRGCRGLFPENTIPAFLHALNLGVDVLELDVVVTGDGYVLVSHEPWMNPEICTGPEGQSWWVNRRLISTNYGFPKSGNMIAAAWAIVDFQTSSR